MPDLRPFRGIRYQAQAGDPALLMAPPYDVIGPEEHLALCRRSPHNIVHLDLGSRASAAQPPPPNWYDQAARDLAAWRRQGILAADPEPALYLYSQEFDDPERLSGSFALPGQPRRRTLLFGALRLEPYDTGRILPHENTMPGPKADRLRLMQTTHANLSPILAFFPDPDAQVYRLLETFHAAKPTVAFRDAFGIAHELRCVWDTPDRRRLLEALAPLPLYIADGHHRYETSLVYQHLQRSGDPGRPDERPYDFVLAACMSSADPGLVIRPTHRLLHWQGPPEVEEIVERARPPYGGFDVERLPASDVEQVLAALGSRRERPSFVLCCGSPKLFHCLSLRDDVAMEDAPSPPASPLRRLPAAVFGHAFVGKLLAGSHATLSYEPDARAAIRSVDSGAARLAGLLPGVLTSELMAVVNCGERMPPKSTYFWPKPLSGMLLRSLREF